ncbi:MAG TPA: hypothetical protein VGI03_03780 [Verrucomicrobiae bacterium]
MNQTDLPQPHRIDVQFAEAPPVQLQIIKKMKNKDQGKPITPSLFQIAASFDELATTSQPRRTSAPLPLDDWTFSRERLEKALRARISGIKKSGVTVLVEQVEPAAKQPVQRIARPVKKARAEARPVQYHPFDLANPMPGVA